MHDVVASCLEKLCSFRAVRFNHRGIFKADLWTMNDLLRVGFDNLKDASEGGWGRWGLKTWSTALKELRELRAPDANARVRLQSQARVPSRAPVVRASEKLIRFLLRSFESATPNYAACSPQGALDEAPRGQAHPDDVRL